MKTSWKRHKGNASCHFWTIKDDECQKAISLLCEVRKQIDYACNNFHKNIFWQRAKTDKRTFLLSFPFFLKSNLWKSAMRVLGPKIGLWWKGVERVVEYRFSSLECNRDRRLKASKASDIVDIIVIISNDSLTILMNFFNCFIILRYILHFNFLKMANRRFRIFCRSETSNEYSVIVESPFAKKFLLLQSSAILTLGFF